MRRTTTTRSMSNSIRRRLESPDWKRPSRSASIGRFVELMSVNPARILKLPGGSLGEGALADVTILAPEASVVVSVKTMRSKSKNTPFDGWTLRGAVVATVVGGKTKYVNPGFQDFRI